MSIEYNVIVKENNTVLTVLIPNKQAQSIDLKRNDAVHIVLTKLEVKT